MQADAAERPIEGAAIAKQEPPRIDPNEVARPQREEHEYEDDSARSTRRESCHVVAEWKGENRVGQRDCGGDSERSPRDPEVRRIGGREDDPKVVEGPDMDELPGEGVDGPERRHEQNGEGADVD